MSEWISVKDRLPNSHEWVLVKFREGDGDYPLQVAYHDTCNWSDQGHRIKWATVEYWLDGIDIPGRPNPSE